ncbi:hypothetical protein [Chromobacterium phragmitis]|uniref:CR-type domain-containing protein n=1 Tax=Chromobacterium phragmitis TaxID=2202141 RepID=A0A344UPF7_9NEIS|nr:hypothetical protein [Chromobacterium phragmitis]AXE37155.1 hypothetical protein DK843_22660 [Chromobacterium phragmitis]
MEIINLQQFCASQKDDRAYLQKPFHLDGKTYATNGHILVEVNGVEHAAAAADESVIDMLRSILSHLPDKEYQPLPPGLPAVERVECKACGGKGDRRACPSCNGHGVFKHHGYDYACTPCDGVGHIKSACHYCNAIGSVDGAPVRIGRLLFNGRYVAMIASLPNAKISTASTFDVAGFTFQGGRGALMPRRY